MISEKTLHARSESKCELCGAAEGLGVYEVPPSSNGGADQCVLICSTCRQQMENPEKIDVHHWRCGLNESMWSQVPAVQVMVWRMLKRLSSEGWAQATGEGESTEATVKHVDSNGAVLATGDTVTLIKDLDVKGANFTAKRGTVVRGISLVADNPEHIEARVNGQRIVILTQFVKKA